MRARVIIIVLVVVCVFMGVALINVSKNVEVQTVDKNKTVTEFSNKVEVTSTLLEDYKVANTNLNQQLTAEKGQVNNLIQDKKRLEGDLERVSSERDDVKRQAETAAKAAEEAAKIAQQEIERRTAKIAELEQQRETLTKTMDGLTNQIAMLEVKISDTEKKLASAEGQNDFLVKELKRLQSEKAELERQFHDLKIVKEQVKKLTEEQHVSLRLEWMRRGLYNDMKGAEQLTKPRVKPAAANTNVNLDVEIKRTGGATIKSATNTPAMK
jgi:chromosome segregation ATPase